MPVTTAAHAPGSARERLAGAALPYAQANVSAIDDLHVARVRALRKTRVTLDQRTLAASPARHRHRRRPGPRADCPSTARVIGTVVAVRLRAAARAPSLSVTKGISACGKTRRAHVDGDLAVGLERGLDDAAARLDANRALGRQALRAHELHEAARTVAALLDLAAVGVEYAIAKIDVGPRGASRRRRTWSQPTPKCRSARRRISSGPRSSLLAHAVEHDEIVAQPLHLGEAQAASHCGRGPNPRSKRATGNPTLARERQGRAIAQRKRALDA